MKVVAPNEAPRINRALAPEVHDTELARAFLDPVPTRILFGSREPVAAIAYADFLEMRFGAPPSRLVGNGRAGLIAIVKENDFFEDALFLDVRAKRL